MMHSPFCLSLVTQAPVLSARDNVSLHRFIRHKSYAYKHVFDRIDTPSVMERVASSLQCYPYLIEEFNKFLPVGYHIKIDSDARPSKITFVTPSGTTEQLLIEDPQYPQRSTLIISVG